MLAGLKVAISINGVVPLGLRDSYAKLVKGETNEIFIPHSFVGFEKVDEWVNKEDVDFYDGESGILIILKRK